MDMVKTVDITFQGPDPDDSFFGVIQWGRAH